MADQSVPSFCNDHGTEQIRVGVKELKCIGASPPHDHPHIFLDMGRDDQIICPYCSTLFIFDAMLEPGQSDPSYCLYRGASAA